LSNHKSSSLREQKSTLIHELTHIVSLNTSQVNPDISEPLCSTKHIRLEEGCAKNNAYITDFFYNFWSSGVSLDDFGQMKYDSKKFITEYATTNVVEDFAESFAFFVLEKDFQNLGNLPKYEKVKFFYGFPELLSMRSEMRQVLGKNIIRAKKNMKNNL
jgi:hypothetical protein